MKKTVMVVIGGIVFIGAANAGFAKAKTAAMDGDTEQISSVKNVNEMRDDTNVIMHGKIISQLKDDKYTFQDDTGRIVVEIDDDAWHGETITPDDTVKVYGDVDRGIFTTEIDVEHIEKQ